MRELCAVRVRLVWREQEREESKMSKRQKWAAIFSLCIRIIHLSSFIPVVPASNYQFLLQVETKGEEKKAKRFNNIDSLTAKAIPKRKYVQREPPECRPPKGKTYRAAHYGPRIYKEERVEQIINNKKINDSKPGGRSWTQGKMKSKKVLGSERSNPPNMARVWSFSWNEECSDQSWDQMWNV